MIICIFKVMKESRIGEIVHQVFDKAKEQCVSTAKSALSNDIANDITEEFRYINYRTLERAYDRYINKKEKDGPPSAESVDLFCKYLGYRDYKDFIKENKSEETLNKGKGGTRSGEEEQSTKEKKRRWVITFSISIAFAATLMVAKSGMFDEPDEPMVPTENKCMVWAKNHYEEVSCNFALHKKYGTKVEPYDSKFIANFKKVEVTMKTDFFTEGTYKPLIWYTKNKDGKIEYFTSSGLHPITGKTLDEITPYIIQKYVPLHSGDINSFAN